MAVDLVQRLLGQMETDQNVERIAIYSGVARLINEEELLARQG
jgi:hypothetical protein